MRGPLRTAVMTTAALVAAVVLFVATTLPPRRVELAADRPARARAGAFHVHTSRSDGTGSVEEVAAAARRAGLDFVVLTDHGDGTRPPLTPAYLDGVLIIDAVELSTSGGHIAALGLEGPAPYSLAGRSEDVVEDVHRLGGLVVLAHPRSPRGELRWRGEQVPYDGFEWLNADSEWRDESPWRLAATAVRGLVRGPESIVSLFARDERAFLRWDRRDDRRPPSRAFGIAALDAHARIGWDGTDREEPAQWTFLAKPTYEEMFRAVAQIVVLDDAPTGDPIEDAQRLIAAVSEGRTYSVVTAMAGPATLEFSAEQGGRTLPMGGILADGVATFRAAVPTAADSTISLLANGRPVAEGLGSLMTEQPAGPTSVYRVEVMREGHLFPWIVSNPIFGSAARQNRPADVVLTPASARLQPFPDFADWRVERNESSTATMAVDAARQSVTWHFELGPGRPAGQFTALSVPIEGEEGYESIQFDARANRPMRVWLQVRLPGPSESQRWGKSVYLGTEDRRVVVRLEDLEPIGRTTSLRPVVARIRSVLFVIDTVNTPPGSSGEVVLANIALGLGSTGGD